LTRNDLVPRGDAHDYCERADAELNRPGFRGSSILPGQS
jgi:hypothetical protein